MHDLFVSHASEDKELFVRPLARALTEAGVDVWYDEFALKIGDSLRRSIDAGLASSRFGLVVLSPHFFKKAWTAYEMDGLVAKSISSGPGVILPIWHYVDREDVERYSLPLADKVALNSVDGIEYLVREISNAVLGVTGSGLLSAVPEPVKYKECSKCGGDGLCPNCEGHGGVVDPVFAILTMGLGSFSRFTCSVCDGNKKCPVCKGDGKVEAL